MSHVENLCDICFVFFISQSRPESVAVVELLENKEDFKPDIADIVIANPEGDVFTACFHSAISKGIGFLDVAGSPIKHDCLNLDC